MVVVAMSGGVDSSTTAALLVERGYHVIGMMMRLWAEGEGDDRFAANRCCSPEAVADARGVCQKLGIPFYLLNFEAAFKAHVVDFFLDGYARGVTPNPCLECNRQIKFGALLDKARALGADYLATGHYARVREREGKFELLKGLDPKKDQSYALSILNQEHLARAMFPLGEFTKEETRAMARRFGLRVAEKRESQDLCFIADGNYRNFLQRNIPSALVRGNIVDTRGNVLGHHDGLANYTIGQRKGLGFAVGEPLYVLALDAARNTVVVGRAAELGKRELIAGGVNWIAGELPSEPMRVTVKIRYRAAEAHATIYPHPGPPPLATGEGARVVFDEPLRDITPGQAAVFYDGEVCLGSGIIQVTGE
ncbi:MAG: tRNA 2-thiouridine(34) synthase MnmA [Chloroflexi bacterium]|nr:tRNA 2-thiouridine(34) synthase MnmA [Chloroflexota bacterium]